MESRYPIICSKCAKNANNELKQQNYHIKTKILNYQLQQSVNQFNSYQNLSLIFLLIWLFAMSFIIFFDIFTIIYHTYGIEIALNLFYNFFFIKFYYRITKNKYTLIYLLYLE